MKSIKPGRGPSGMNLAGSVIAIIFGIFWTICASGFTRSASQFPSIGAAAEPFPIISGILPLFGLLFIGAGVVNAIYHYQNARGSNRYSTVDIVDKQEEGDPADSWVKEGASPAPARHPAGKFCTACGHRLEGDFTFCPGCGRDLSRG